MRLGRLARRQDFQQLRRLGRRYQLATLWVVVAQVNGGSRDAQSDGVRVAFAIPRRAGTAVQRNRFRRRVREAVRLSRVPPGAYLIGPREGKLDASFAAIRADITRLEALSEFPREDP